MKEIDRNAKFISVQAAATALGIEASTVCKYIKEAGSYPDYPNILSVSAGEKGGPAGWDLSLNDVEIIDALISGHQIHQNVCIRYVLPSTRMGKRNRARKSLHL